MGMGDEIMAAAQARAVGEALGVKADFGEWSKIWKDNPYVAMPGTGGFPVKNMTGDRPYVLGQTDKKIVFNPNFRAVPGDLYLSQRETKDARNAIGKHKNFILLQPEVKMMFSKGNKAWPRKHWQQLAEMLKGYTLLQMVQNRSEANTKLNHAKIIVADTFRVAAAVIKESSLLITTDGGLHHAAAALDKPAVVLWTGFTHPKHLGYQSHLNLRYDNSEPCGMKVECDHCKQMAEKLTPEMVYQAVCEAIEKYKIPHA